VAPGRYRFATGGTLGIVRVERSSERGPAVSLRGEDPLTSPLVTGASLLGEVGNGPYADFSYLFGVPGEAPGTRFEVFPGAPAVTDDGYIAFKGNYSVPDTNAGDPEHDAMQDGFDAVTGTFERHFAVSIDDLFGEPIERNGRTVITAASIERIGGFGLGGGSGEGEDSEGGDVGSGAGAGGGGGGTLRARPVAVIEVSDEGVRVEPVIDFTNVLVTALLALAAMFSLGRRLR